ncbi:putative orfan [Tupanvirus soda lake]|uniref:Orfan n=2 Tax=Tupanvirus TaxID=2094720 RepID=A0AC62AAZ5_9VIRU|nr:putative orfan [Tupanvirus soda lake]QKU34916.1 putative orfan [Tupanvirus soda lake]
MNSFSIVLHNIITQFWHYLVYYYYFPDQTKRIGINFEGGKIISYVKSNPLCIATSNIQISMDSPYFGQQADGKIRSKGRAECQLSEYYEKEPVMIESISNVFKKINFMMKEDLEIGSLVVQISRGRAADSFITDIVEPILTNTLSIQNINKIVIVKGYRTKDYYCHQSNHKFIFVNIGMFARLNPDCNIAEVCVPVKTIVLEHQHKGKTFSKTSTSYHTDDIAYGIPLIKPVELAGIPDDSDFILPNNFSYKHILSFFAN